MKNLILLAFALLALSMPVCATDVTIISGQMNNLPFNPLGIGSDRTISVTVTSGSPTVTSANLFPPAAIGIGGFRITIDGVAYTVQTVTSASSLTLSSNYAGSSGTASMRFYKYVLMRVYATASFRPNGESYVVQAGAPGIAGFFKQSAASIVPDGSGNDILYLPQFILPATTDATITNQAKYIFAFHRPDGSLLQLYTCGATSQLRLPPTTPTNYGDLCTFNALGGIVPPAFTAYTKQEIDSRFRSCTTNQLYYFAAPGNDVSCLTLGSGLSISSGVITATGGPGGGDVNGPASSTSNAIARFNGTTGKLIQNSTVTLDNAGVLSGATLGTGNTLGDVTVNVAGTDATGDIYYRTAGGIFTRLPIGTTNQVLTVAAGLPAWGAPIGDVAGPASSTDTALARFNGATGKIIQNSSVTLNGSGVFSGAVLGTGNTLGGVTMGLGSDATGDLYYRNSGGLFTRLPIGSSSQVLTVAGGLPSWAAAAAPNDTNFINPVNEFGATCDGVTNTQTQFQNAINAAVASATRKTVFVPGDCLINSLTLTGPVVLLGSGQGSILRSASNSPIVDMVADANFVGGSVQNLHIIGSVSAGANQIGVRMDNATGALRFLIRDVLIENTGGDGLYWGKAFSSVVDNVRITESAGYNFHYNAPNQPSNIASNIYVGRVRASQPVAYYIEAGDFSGYNLNGIDNILTNSIWMQVGTTSSPATAVLNGFNAESWTSRGFKVQSSSTVVLDGVSLIVGDGGTAAASKIGIEFTLNGDGTTFFAPLIKRSKIGDSVNFADGLSAYNNSQPIQAPGFAPIDLTGLGPQTGGGANLTTYRNTTTSATARLARSDSRYNKTTITSSTTISNIGGNYYEVDSTSGPVTLTLEWPGWAVPGTMIVVKDVGGNAATNNITIAASAGGTVNGSTFVMTKNKEAVMLMPNSVGTGSDFRVVARQLDVIGDVSKVAAAAVQDYFPYWDSTGKLTSQGPIYRLSNSLVVLEGLLNNSNNSFDIGSLSSNRFRTAYFGTSVDVGINSSVTGSVVFRNSTNANSTTLRAGAPSSALTFTLPTTLPASAGCLQVDNAGAISQTGSACGSGGSGLGDPGANGIVVRTAVNITTARTITGTTNRITVSNGDGVSGNPTLDVGTDVVTLTGTQTLTNKTLTSPVISTIVNTGTLTLPTSTDTLVGRATTDTLTNKSIGGSTNVFTPFDSLFSLQDNGDATKQLQFQLSGLTTATTRTLTVPDVSSTIAVLGLAQTFSAAQTINVTGSLTLGTGSSATGQVTFKNATNANNTILQPGAPSSSITFTLPATLPASAGCLEVNSSGVITQTGSACGAGGGGVTGSGTANSLPKWATSSSLTDSGITDTGTTITVLPVAASSGANRIFAIRNPGASGLTASTEATAIQIGGDGSMATTTMSHATGALTLQRDIRIIPVTHAFAGSSTLTTAITLDAASPIAGTNATLTNSVVARLLPSAAAHHGLWIENTSGSASGDLLRLSVSGVDIVRFIPSNGDINSVFSDGALGTTATDGFIYAPSMAGVPTGVPTGYTGTVPLVIDTTNSRLYGRISGSWVNLSAGGGGSGTVNSGTQFQIGYYAATGTAISGLSNWTTNAQGNFTLAPSASTSGSPSLETITGPAHTTLAADTEASDVRWNLNRTVQFTGGAGAFTDQRAIRIQAPTYSASTTETITNAVTMELNSPSAGTNMTLTNSYAARFIQSAAAHVPVAISLASSPTGDALQVINSSGTAILALTSDGYVVNGSTLSQSNYTIKNSSGTGGFELDGFSGALYLVPRGGPAAGNNFIFRTPSEVDYVIFNSSVRGIGVNTTPTTAGHFLSNSTSAGGLLAVSASGATVQTFEVQHTGSETSTVSLVNLISNNSSGTAATGFGLRNRYRLESSTTNDQTAVETNVKWTDATHASRTSAYTISTVNNAGSATEVFGVQAAQTYGAAEFNRGNSSGSFTIDWNNGNNQRATATGNWTTVTFSNIKVGAQYTLRVIQDATGGRTWTPPTTMKFPGGVAGNVLTGTANAQDLFVCISSDGTNLYCNGLFDVKNP